MPLSVAAQTAFAQLAEAAAAADLSRSVADLTGDFCTKTVKGKTYWYFQYPTVSGSYRQLYIGPDSPKIQQLIERRAAGAASAASLARLATVASVQGCATTLPAHFKVIRRLADHGFFRAGGVLIGTHAFEAYGNLLGVRWENALHTEDVDFAHAGRSLSIALPATVEIETSSAIDSLQMGFIPIITAAGKPTGSFVIPETPEFKLDFLTPMHRDGQTAYEHPQLHVPLLPLRFIEYSLEQVEQTTLFSRSGAVTVSVPAPARYGLHKLLVYGERTGRYRAKAGKDLRQAASLLSCLRESRPWEVEDAWHDLQNRGKGWRARAAAGVAAMDRLYPDLALSEWLRPA